MNRIIPISLLSISLLLNNSAVLAEKKEEKDEHLVTSLANEYLRAFATEEDEEDNEDTANTSSTQNKQDKKDNKNTVTFGVGQNKVEIELIAPLTELDKYKVAFHLLDVHVNKGGLPVNKTVDKAFVRSMELVYGGKEGRDNLVHDLNYSTGIVSETALAWTLAQPNADMAMIEHNQAIVQELVQNRNLYNQLLPKLQTLATVEESLLSFYTPADAVFYEGLKKIGLYPPVGEASPKTCAGLSGAVLFGNGFNTLMGIIQTAGGLPLLIHGISSPNGLPQFQWNREQCILYGGLFTFMGPLTTYLTYQTVANIIRITCQAQQRLIDLATYINTLREIQELINSNHVLKNHFVPARYLNKLFDGKVSDNATRLLSLLSYGTFKGKPSYWFSYNGRTLATYALLQNTKDALCDAIMAGGQIGALVSAAQLYLAHSNTPVKYSFVEFVNNDRPYIKATNLWNPRLDPAKAVPSSLEMGGISAYNMVLTGGNGLGKSTIMKGLLYDLLIAQTFGIAPADRLIMTPFTRMICHTNVTDNVAEGLSGFTAELAMKDRILKEYAQLKPNEFVITVFDELFKSTNPEDAAILSKELCRNLAAHSNNISIIATHLASVTDLEKEGTHANYHPGSIPQGDGLPAKPTYTLEKGASFDHNAVALYNAAKK